MTPEDDIYAGLKPLAKEDDIYAGLEPIDAAPLQAALLGARDAVPEQESKKRQLAQKLGIPTELVPTSLNEAEGEAFGKKHVASDILAKSPKTAKVLEKDANIHKNDIDNLQGFESVFSAKAIAGDIGAGLLSIKSGGIGILRAGADVLGLDSASEFLAKQQQGLERLSGYISPNTENMGAVVKGVHSAVKSVTAMAPMIAAAAPIAVGGAVVAAGRILAAWGAGMTFGQEYGVAKDAGLGTGMSLVHASEQGAVEYLTEMLPAVSFLKGLTGKTGLAKAAADFLFKDIVGEQIATASHDFFTWVNINPDKTLDEYLAERPAAAVESFVATIVGGGIQVGGAHAVKRVLAKKEQMQEADAGMETLQKITELAANNSVRKNDPEKFHEAVSQLSDDTDLKEVFVSQAVLEGIFADKAGAELLQKLPEVAAQMAEARATQGDVSISMADYATYFAGDFDDVLLPALKVSAKGATFEQSKAYAQSRQTDMQAQAEELAAASEPIMTREEFDAAQAEIPELNPPVSDRRAHTEDGARVERRVDAPARKKFKDMTPVEQQEAYYTDPGTGAKNLRAYEEADKLPVQISVDVNDLGWMNNQMSSATADDMLRAVTQAFGQATGEFYRTGGDEFFSQANTPEEADAIVAKARAILDTVTLEATLPDGSIITKRGLEITYGRGPDKDEADVALYGEKEKRKAERLAAGHTLVDKNVKGADPSGVSRQPAKGKQSKGNIQEAVTYEQYLTKHKNKDALAKADVQKVHDAILAGIKSTGRYSEVVAEFNALSIRAAYVQMAARAGLKPSELYAQKPLTFASSGVRGFNQTAGVTLSDVAHHVNANGRQPLPEDVIGEAAGGATEFALQDVPLSDIVTDTEPADVGVVAEYAGRSTAAPAIVLGRGNNIVDGRHRVAAALARGDKTIPAYVPVSFEEATDIGSWFNQGEKGSFDPENFTMAFLNSADLTTPVHEAGHLYLELLNHVASGPNAPKDVVEDLAKTMTWFGVTQEQWAAMSLEQKRPYHEQWAESWERYGIEGVAPSAELRPVFARFSAWLTKAYKSVKEFVKTHPAAGKLNDEMRAVFDRMLASQEAIAEAEMLRGYEPLFASAKEAKISEEEFLKYVNRGQDATEVGIADMEQKSLADMKWLSGAKSKALRELQRTADRERAKIHAQVQAEVSAEKVYVARIELLKRDSEFKIHTGVLKELLPDLDTAKLRGMLSTENGTHPDQLAERFGFSGGMVLVNEILAAEDMNAKIEGITDQRMLEQHGELIDPRAIEQAANLAVHNEGRARFMASGLKILEMKGKKDSPISSTAMAKAAKDAAYNAIAQKRVRDLRPAQYEAAETRSNLQAKKLAAKKPEEAIIAMRAALLNNRLAKAAYDAQEEAKKARAYLAKFQNAGTRGNLDIEYVAQIDALMKPFDLSANLSLKEIEERKSLDAFVQQQKALGFEPAINIDLINKAALKSYKELTVAELREIVDTVHGIEHLGRLKNKLLTAKDAREFAEHIDEAKASILERANRTVVERGAPTDVIGLFGQWGRSFTAEHRKFASIMREMDGGQDNGVMYQRFLRPMNAAGNKELELREKFNEDLAKLFKPVVKTVGKDGRFWSTKRQIPGTTLSMTHEQRLSALMNMGNIENQQRLLDGGIAGRSKPSMNDLAKILDTFTKEELDWAQSVGDYYESLRPLIEAQELALTGLKPKWIPVQPLVTKHGTYRGWYHPAKYDVMLSTRSESLEAGANSRGAMQGGFHPDKTRDSYIQGRAEAVKGRPLLLSFDVISQHLGEVAHRLAWQEYLTDANRMLKALEDPIRTHYGPEILQSLRKTIDHVTVGNAPAHGAAERALNYARIGTTIVGLGWRATTAAIQPTGLAQSWARIGGPWIARGLAKYFRNPLEAGRLADAASGRMPHRGNTQSREIADMLNTLRAGDTAGRISEAIRASRFYMIAKMQRVVDVITWHGANEKALSQLKYENAVTQEERADIEKQAADLADQGVIDSQGSGLIADMAPVQNGPPAMKLFTNFYSYFNTTLNQNVEAYRRTNFKSPAQVGIFAADLLILDVLPVVLGVAIKNLMKGDCDWDDGTCLAKRYGSEQISYIAGQMLLLRELGTAFSVAAGGESYGYQGVSGLRLITDTHRLVTEFAEGDVGFDVETFKKANRVGGAALHYPAGQINSTLDGIIAIEQGDVEGVSVIGALIAGPPK